MRALYLRKLAREEDVKRSLDDAGISERRFIDRISRASQGNFLYLYYFSQGLRSGDESLLALNSLPQGLNPIYAELLQKIRSQRLDIPWDEAFKPVLGILAVARLPLSSRQIARFAGVSRTADRDNPQPARPLLAGVSFC